MKYLSVYENDSEILEAFQQIYLRNKWFDADITYSKGVFWHNLRPPRYKSDLIPVDDSITKDDATKLSTYKEYSLNSIVFDPPFLFRKRKSPNSDKTSGRFGYFKSYEELLTMYEQSLKAMNRKLKKRGFIFFKCQDMTDGKFYCTHVDVVNMARDNGFELQDIGIKSTKKKLQRDAKQQNCLAKTHSYWLVLKK